MLKWHIISMTLVPLRCLYKGKSLQAGPEFWPKVPIRGLVSIGYSEIPIEQVIRTDNICLTASKRSVATTGE